MSDIAKAIVGLLSRSMFEDHFECFERASTVAATTYTGSVYMIEIAEGKPEQLVYEGRTYHMRQANATINGARHTGVYVGFNLETGTILVTDEDYRMIRRSSSLDRLELLASE